MVLSQTSSQLGMFLLRFVRPLLVIRVNNFPCGSLFAIKFARFAKHAKSRIYRETHNFALLLDSEGKSRFDTTQEMLGMGTDYLIQNGNSSILIGFENFLGWLIFHYLENIAFVVNV